MRASPTRHLPNAGRPLIFYDSLTPPQQPRRRGRKGYPYGARPSPSTPNPSEQYKQTKKRIKKSERDERMDITMALTPVKSYLGGFTKPRDLRTSNWFAGGAYLQRGKIYERPSVAAYTPHTVFLLESRYPIRSGRGIPTVPQHFLGICPENVFLAMMRHCNTPQAPNEMREAMDNAVWPGMVGPKKKVKKEQWWESPEELEMMGFTGELHPNRVYMVRERMMLQQAQNEALKLTGGVPVDGKDGRKVGEEKAAVGEEREEGKEESFEGRGMRKRLARLVSLMSSKRDKADGPVDEGEDSPRLQEEQDPVSSSSLEDTLASPDPDDAVLMVDVISYSKSDAQDELGTGKEEMISVEEVMSLSDGEPASAAVVEETELDAELDSTLTIPTSLTDADEVIPESLADEPISSLESDVRDELALETQEATFVEEPIFLSSDEADTSADRELPEPALDTESVTSSTPSTLMAEAENATPASLQHDESPILEEPISSLESAVAGDELALQKEETVSLVDESVSLSSDEAETPVDQEQLALASEADAITSPTPRTAMAEAGDATPAHLEHEEPISSLESDDATAELALQKEEVVSPEESVSLSSDEAETAVDQEQLSLALGADAITSPTPRTAMAEAEDATPAGPEHEEPISSLESDVRDDLVLETEETTFVEEPIFLLSDEADTSADREPPEPALDTESVTSPTPSTFVSEAENATPASLQHDESAILEEPISSLELEDASDEVALQKEETVFSEEPVSLSSDEAETPVDQEQLTPASDADSITSPTPSAIMAEADGATPEASSLQEPISSPESEARQEVEDEEPETISLEEPVSLFADEANAPGPVEHTGAISSEETIFSSGSDARDDVELQREGISSLPKLHDSLSSDEGDIPVDLEQTELASESESIQSSSTSHTMVAVDDSTLSSDVAVISTSDVPTSSSSSHSPSSDIDSLFSPSPPAIITDATASAPPPLVDGTGMASDSSSASQAASSKKLGPDDVDPSLSQPDEPILTHRQLLELRANQAHIDVNTLTPDQITEFARLEAAGVPVPVLEYKKSTPPRARPTMEFGAVDWDRIDDRRKIYLPMLKNQTFFRPLLAMTFPTRPIAQSVLRLSKSHPRGWPFYASVSSDDRKVTVSFAGRMREMRLRRMRGLCLDTVKRLLGYHGGFPGLRFHSEDIGRGVNGEGLEWEWQGKVRVAVGSWYPRADEEIAIYRAEPGAEALELVKMDDHGRWIAASEVQKEDELTSTLLLELAEMEQESEEADAEELENEFTEVTGVIPGYSRMKQSEREKEGEVEEGEDEDEARSGVRDEDELFEDEDFEEEDDRPAAPTKFKKGKRAPTPTKGKPHVLEEYDEDLLDDEDDRLAVPTPVKKGKKAPITTDSKPRVLHKYDEGLLKDEDEDDQPAAPTKINPNIDSRAPILQTRTPAQRKPRLREGDEDRRPAQPAKFERGKKPPTPIKKAFAAPKFTKVQKSFTRPPRMDDELSFEDRAVPAALATVKAEGPKEPKRTKKGKIIPPQTENKPRFPWPMVKKRKTEGTETRKAGPGKPAKPRAPALKKATG